MLLYNRVADNRARNLDPCVAVAPAAQGDPSLLRVVAAHGYGTVDLQWSTGGAAWVVFELASLSAWNADPTEKHIQMAAFDAGILDPADAPFTSGKFQGFRGVEGRKEWSAGFFTLTSEWQQYRTFFYTKPKQRLAFACVKTAGINPLIAGS